MRISLKARQIGYSDLIALEMVLVASGMHPFVEPNNCNIVSKIEDDALEVVQKCYWWIDVLRHSPKLEPYLRVSKSNLEEIKFAGTGFKIQSDTQNKNALRSKTGHAYLDEFSHYVWQTEIWLGGIPSTFSRPDLRITVISTPNGTGEKFHEIYTDTFQHSDWSRHRINLREAIEQGANPDAEVQARKTMTASQYAQECDCSFLGAMGETFTREFLRASYGVHRPSAESVLWFGVDTASTTDTTAVVLLWFDGGRVRIGDCYQIPMTPYPTNVEKRRAGQELIVDALARVFRPVGMVIDITGDKSRMVHGITPLFPLMQEHRGHDTLILPQHISQGWKKAEVQAIKDCLADGKTQFVIGRTDYIFSRGNASDFVVNRTLPSDDLQRSPEAFIAATFEPAPYHLLEQDFQKIQAKWIGEENVVYSAKRDGTGHADAFWACLIGHSVARNPEANQHGQKSAARLSMPKQAYSQPEMPDYMGLL